jgi:uncharacterized protein (DUF2235 family)
VGTKVGSALAKTAGLTFGYRLQDDVADAYRFLMNTYQPGDRVFLFGFSRGAYTSRVIAAMLQLYGLAMPGNDALVPYAVEMMWAISKRKADHNQYFELARAFKRTISGRECRVHFLGVWDTVNSVGWIGSPLSIPYTRKNPGVAVVRHAKAIDERRGFFRVSWFADVPGADIQEVWFPGVHCDVGGGYPEEDSGISKYPLEWMAREAVLSGLLVDQDRLAEVLGQTDGGDFVKADPRATLHKSLTLAWLPAEVVPKKHWNFKLQRWGWRMNLGRRRTLPEVPVVHDVAWDIPGYVERLPVKPLRLSAAFPVEVRLTPSAPVALP